MRRFILNLLAIIGTITLMMAGFLAWSIYRLTGESFPVILPSGAVVLNLTLGDANLPQHPQRQGMVSSFLSGASLSVYSIVEGLEHAAKDDHVKGILLTLDGNAFQIATVQEIRNALKDFKKSGKFIYTYTDTFGELSNGTLGYYLAAASSKIWMMPLGTVNITGMMMEVPFAKKALEDLHIRPQMGRREAYKGAVESFTESDFSPTHKENMEQILGGLTTQIITDIAEDRGLDSAQVRHLINMAPHFPTQAISEKLIDHIGYKDQAKDAIETALGKKPHYLDFETYSRSISQHSSKEHIAIVYAEGLISKGKSGKNPLSDDMAMDAVEIAKALQDATKNDQVKAIVLRVDSGGGDAIASDLIAREVERAKLKKPVIISMANYAASGGYWFACDANKIVAQPGTITGSIGVFAGKVVTQGFWEHFGVHWGEIHKGDNASLWSTGHDFSVEGWQKLDGFLDQIYDAFLDRVAKGRRLDREKVHEIAKGRVWTGVEAKENGLVDALGGIFTAIEIAKKEAGIAASASVALDHLPLAKSPLDLVFGRNKSEETHLLACYPALRKALICLDGLFAQPRIEMKLTEKAGN